MMGSLSFHVPWVLAGLVVLPLLWRLLRVTPPPPRIMIFPAVSLLRGVPDAGQTAQRTPWWLVVLRLSLAGLLLLAAAQPVLNAPSADQMGGNKSGPLLLVVDNGWAAARSWSDVRQRAAALIRQDGHGPVFLLPTAQDGAGMPVHVWSHVDEESLGSLQPYPWSGDRKAAALALDGLPPMGRVVWLSDGLDDEQGKDFAKALGRMGPLEIEGPSHPAMVLLPPSAEQTDLTPRLLRAVSGGLDTVDVSARDDAGHILATAKAVFQAGDMAASATLVLPPELRNRVERLVIEGQDTAAAQVLLDPRWRRRPVGLIHGGAESPSPLLDDQFYVRNALPPQADVHQGSLSEVLKQDISLLVLPDDGALAAGEISSLTAWVEQGGLLVRLAGSGLARNPDPLLPVILRGGGRTLGGAMSWTHPMAVAPMPEKSPFAGLPIPSDLRVSSQLLAEPSADLNAKTWARLEDGTPLVTADRRGRGWVVLVHTTIWPDWSNLGLTGLLPSMMGRLLDLSLGLAPQNTSQPLPPRRLMDGFGRLMEPGAAARPLPPEDKGIPGPAHPPGFYGDEQARRAFNLSPSLAAPRALPLPLQTFGAQPQETDLLPPLLSAAMALFLLDLAVSLRLRRRTSLLRIPLAAGLAVVFMVMGMVLPAESRAEDFDAALRPRLAYFLSGDAALDATSQAGLHSLTIMLERRTTAWLEAPRGVNPDRDDLAFYPLIYWPVPPVAKPLTASARAKINDYLRHGGMILLDSRDGGQGGSEPMRLITEGIDIPALAPMSADHVLTHSFYILRDEPGRLSGQPVFIEADTNPTSALSDKGLSALGGGAARDGVSPVIIGSHDWAAGWAANEDGRPLFAVVPGGEAQREQSYRFGINLVMYALTGNYKADQVHLPAIMERLRR